MKSKYFKEYIKNKKKIRSYYKDIKTKSHLYEISYKLLEVIDSEIEFKEFKKLIFGSNNLKLENGKEKESI